MSKFRGAGYIIAVDTLAPAAGVPFLEIFGQNLLAPDTQDEVGILSITGVLLDATASNIGLVRTTAPGTPKAAKTFAPYAENAISTPVGSIGSDWDVLPTVDAAVLAGTLPWMTRTPLPAVVGASFVLKWSERSPLRVFGDSSVVLWNYGAAAAGRLAITIEWAYYPIPLNQLKSP